MQNNELTIKEVNRDVYADFVLNLHYAGRIPSVSFAYGLFRKNKCVGVLTIGKPASNSLCIGVCGKSHSSKVYELNRLIILENQPKNTLSFFVGGVLRKLRNKELVLISYADTAMKHCGYIYQATNWIYTGSTKARTDKYTPSGKHSRHYVNDANIHLRKLRSSKHRYVMFTKRAKYLRSELKYAVEPYPKGNGARYELGFKLKDIIYNRLTDETYIVSE